MQGPNEIELQTIQQATDKITALDKSQPDQKAKNEDDNKNTQVVQNIVAKHFNGSYADCAQCLVKNRKKFDDAKLTKLITLSYYLAKISPEAARILCHSSTGRIHFYMKKMGLLNKLKEHYAEKITTAQEAFATKNNSEEESTNVVEEKKDLILKLYELQCLQQNVGILFSEKENAEYKKTYEKYAQKLLMAHFGNNLETFAKFLVENRREFKTTNEEFHILVAVAYQTATVSDKAAQVLFKGANRVIQNFTDWQTMHLLVKHRTTEGFTNLVNERLVEQGKNIASLACSSLRAAVILCGKPNRIAQALRPSQLAKIIKENLEKLSATLISVGKLKNSNFSEKLTQFIFLLDKMIQYVLLSGTQYKNLQALCDADSDAKTILEESKRLQACIQLEKELSTADDKNKIKEGCDDVGQDEVEAMQVKLTTTILGGQAPSPKAVQSSPAVVKNKRGEKKESKNGKGDAGKKEDAGKFGANRGNTWWSVGKSFFHSMKSQVDDPEIKISAPTIKKPGKNGK